jgi:hypothetical protein
MLLQAQVNGKSRWCGCFYTRQRAAAARDLAILRLGRYTPKLNYPDADYSGLPADLVSALAQWWEQQVKQLKAVFGGRELSDVAAVWAQLKPALESGLSTAEHKVLLCKALQQAGVPVAKKARFD